MKYFLPASKADFVIIATLKLPTSVHRYLQWVVSTGQFAIMLIIYLINLTEHDDPYSVELKFDCQHISAIFKIKTVQEEFRVTCGYVIF